MPDIVILVVGTNDLPSVAPEVVGSSIEDLVVTLKSIYSVAVVCVCHVIPRGESTIRPLDFWERAKVLQQYLEFVLDSLDCVFCWCQKAFTWPDQDFYLRMEYILMLYRSYRGAILPALRYLWSVCLMMADLWFLFVHLCSWQFLFYILSCLLKDVCPSCSAWTGGLF